jgi:hypothetical protein
MKGKHKFQNDYNNGRLKENYYGIKKKFSLFSLVNKMRLKDPTLP